MVRRPSQPLEGSDAELVASACRDTAAALATRPPEDVARLRELALAGHAEAQWGLSQSLWKGDGLASDRRASVAWAALAALDAQPSRGGLPGLARPLVRLGRALLLGVDAPADPALARTCLEQGRERLLAGEGGSPLVGTKQGMGAEVWLGLAQASGRGFERDMTAGLARIQAALRTGTRQSLLEGLEEAAEGDAWAAFLLTQLEPPPRAKKRVRLYLQAIGGGIEEARTRLDEACRLDAEVAYRLALELPRGSTEQRELLERAAELPEAAALLRLIREVAPDLEETLPSSRPRPARAPGAGTRRPAACWRSWRSRSTCWSRSSAGVEPPARGRRRSPP